MTRYLSARQVAELSNIDRSELHRFEKYLERIAAGETQAAAYAEVYGEVLFEDRSALPTNEPEKHGS